MSIHHRCTVPKEARKGVRLPGTGVTADCCCHVDAGSSVQEQRGLLNPAPSLHFQRGEPSYASFYPEVQVYEASLLSLQ